MNLSQNLRNAATQHIIDDNGVGSGFLKINKAEKDYFDDPGNARFFGIFIGFLVVVLGATGNGVTIWAYSRNKNLQTSFNRLIANLCCVDFISSAVVIPLMLPGYIIGRNVYSYEVCSIIGYLYYTSLASSLYNLVAIAVNRYIGIVKSKNYQKLFTGRRLVICIVSVWVVPALLYLPLVTGRAIHWTDNTLRCGIEPNLSPVFKWYNMTLNITFQAVPLLILIFLYTAIFKKVREVKLKMKEHHKFSKTGHKNRKTISTFSSATLKNKTGYTTDDTGDEYKPSSLLESSGLYHGGNSQKLPEYTSGDSDDYDNDDDYDRSKSLFNDSSTLSNDKNIDTNPNVDTSKYPHQRDSILMLLMQKKRTNTLKNKDFKNKIDSIITQAHENQLMMDKKAGKLVDGDPNKTVLQNLDSKKLSESRRSSSVPYLANKEKLENKKPDPVKNTLDTVQFPAVPTLTLDKNRKSKRLRRCHSTYAKSEIDMLNSNPDVKNNRFWTLKSKKSSRKCASNMSLNGAKDYEMQNMSRHPLGTTARKARDKKAREYKKQQRRNRILKRRHAREKQLIYSSFAIWIAFTLCILPTAVLYLVQVSVGKNFPAGIILVVSCIAWLHSVLNPMIYGYMNTQYRREYTRIANQVTGKCAC